MTPTTTLIKELARKSKSEPKRITDALRRWTSSLGLPDTIEFNRKHKYSTLEIDIALNDQDYTCYFVAVDSQMLLTISVYIQPPIPKQKLRLVKDWILWRNQSLETGQFQLTSDENFVLYYHAVNFAGAGSIDIAVIQNMFNDAVSAYAEYGAEYFDLIIN